MHAATLLAGAALALAACGRERLDHIDEIFSVPDDGRRVLCATGIDTVAGNSQESIDAGLTRAAERGEVIHLYGHTPGKTVPTEKVEAIIAEAARLGLRFVTYPDLVDGVDGVETRGGLALSFDDSNVASWSSLRPLFQQHGVRATFFVSRYFGFSEAGKTQLQELAADGHAIEAHTVNHQHGPDYVEEHGLDAYLDEEVVPSIDALRADGHEVRAFAYPYGARTRELDRAILEHVEVLRSISFSLEGPVTDPCPE